MRATIRSASFSIAFPALGTVIEVKASGGPDDDLAAELARLTEHYEHLWSTYRADSEISRLNAAAGGDWVRIHPDTEALLEQAMAWQEASGGAVTPLIGPLSRLWDVKSWLAELAAGLTPRLPSAEQVTRARRLTHPDRLDLASGRARLGAGAALDLGGLAKGYIADRLAEVAGQQRNRVLVSVGTSSLAATGSWRAGIRGLDGPSIAGIIELTDASLATSGDYLQRLPELLGSRPVHHVIDPRTGYPATGPRQASVRCGDGVAAEAAATCLMVTGALPAGLSADWVTLGDEGVRTSPGLSSFTDGGDEGDGEGEEPVHRRP
ncbi:MAG: FAD:protein FMN transferase [Flaviflexus sp.]|nr:FAD:protein FMN transferase [Flaviflexus sp.]